MSIDFWAGFLWAFVAMWAVKKFCRVPARVSDEQQFREWLKTQPEHIRWLVR